MPTIITHAAFAGALGAGGLSEKRFNTLLAAIVVSILPDADVLAFAFGIPYRHPIGHRGVTHSIAFALLTATMAFWVLRKNDAPVSRVWWFLFVSAVSHPILDAFTNGGLGVALLAPFSNERFFAPWRPVEVSPIGLDGFLSRRGLDVVLSELLWIWIPTAAVIAAVRIVGRKR